MSSTRSSGLRGLILDDRESGVFLEDHLSEKGLEKPTSLFDNAKSVVGGFPMALNDKLGNCTIAGLVHLLQILFAVIGQSFAYPGDAAVEAYYWKLVGRGPTSEDDPGPGLNMLTVLDDIVANGAFGVKIVCWAEISVSNWELLKTALYNFGALYLAVNLPESAETDFSEHKIWTPSGSPIGGHCIVGSGDSPLALYAEVLDPTPRDLDPETDDELVDTETWGDETAFTREWWEQYGAQAFVIIPEVFVEVGHGPLADVNVATLEAACHETAAARKTAA